MSALKPQLWNAPTGAAWQVWNADTRPRRLAVCLRPATPTTESTARAAHSLTTKTRVSAHFLRKSKSLLYRLYYTENTYPKTEYFEFTTVQKTNRKHTGYAIDVTFYKMTILVKGTRFPEGSGLTFFSLFSSRILPWKCDSLKLYNVKVSSFFRLDKWSALWHSLVTAMTNFTRRCQAATKGSSPPLPPPYGI